MRQQRMCEDCREQCTGFHDLLIFGYESSYPGA